MKSKILFFYMVVIIASCSSQDSRINENALLGDNVKVTYLEKLENTTHPTEWLNGLRKDQLFKLVFDQIFDKQKVVYSPDQSYFEDEKLSNKQIKESLNWNDSLKNFSELKEILYYEQWYAPNDLKDFTKKVEYWCPIRVWNPDKDKLELRKKKIFYVKPSSNKKGEAIATSIFSEFELTPSTIFPNWTGLDGNKFINTVFDKIQENKVKAYDPIYIVDKSLKSFEITELEKYVGEKLNSVKLRKSVESLIFEENWYFDAESMNIYKDVISVGFVKKYWENGEFKSKILFVLKF